MFTDILHQQYTVLENLFYLDFLKYDSKIQEFHYISKMRSQLHLQTRGIVPIPVEIYHTDPEVLLYPK